MNNNHTMWRMNRERHSQLMQVAQAERLSKTPKAVTVKGTDSRFVNVSNLVVSFRLWMRARSQSVTQ